MLRVIKYHAVMLKPALVFTREHAGVNCQFLNEVCRDALEAMVCMPWHHCTGFPSANGRLYPVLCVPHIRIRDGRCDTSIVTSLPCYLHADAFIFSCGEAVTWAELGVIREKAGIAAVVSAEQAQLMHYLWSFCILKHLHWWDLPLWHKTDSFICFSDTTAVLLPLCLHWWRYLTIILI